MRWNIARPFEMLFEWARRTGHARATLSAVIARLVRTCALGRAIQYSETAVIEQSSCGVLDSPPAAYAKASAPLDLNPGEALA